MDRTQVKRTEITLETQTRTTIRWRSITLRPLMPDTAIDVEPADLIAAEALRDGTLPGTSPNKTKNYRQERKKDETDK